MKKLNQHGAVSLLSVVIFATIITVVIAAYIHSAISQQTEASNYDFGTRAYYSAESGVQDAVRGMNVNPALKANGQNTCQPLTNASAPGQPAGQLGSSSELGLSYTCQLITTKLTQLTGPVGDSLNATVRLNPVSPGQYNVVINWSKTDKNANIVLQGRTDTSKTVYPRDQWKNADGTAIHPLLRVSIISIPKAGFNRDSIKQNVFFLNPISSVPTDGATTATFAEAAAGTQAPEKIVANAQCYANNATNTFGGFSCQRTIGLSGYDFANYNVYLRMHSIYGDSNFGVSLVPTAGGAPVELANTQATIDVTGKAASVYRRVRQTVPIDGGVRTDNWPEASLIAGDGICKLFRIGGTNSQFQSDCNPLE